MIGMQLVSMSSSQFIKYLNTLGYEVRYSTDNFSDLSSATAKKSLNSPFLKNFPSLDIVFEASDYILDKCIEKLYENFGNRKYTPETETLIKNHILWMSRNGYDARSSQMDGKTCVIKSQKSDDAKEYIGKCDSFLSAYVNAYVEFLNDNWRGIK